MNSGRRMLIFEKPAVSDEFYMESRQDARLEETGVRACARLRTSVKRTDSLDLCLGGRMLVSIRPHHRRRTSKRPDLNLPLFLLPVIGFVSGPVESSAAFPCVGHFPRRASHPCR